jgi:hypothetical protein
MNEESISLTTPISCEVESIAQMASIVLQQQTKNQYCQGVQSQFNSIQFNSISSSHIENRFCLFNNH